MMRIAVAVVLAIVWAALWRDISVPTLTAGLGVSLAVIALSREVAVPMWRPLQRPLASLHFLAAFFVNLVRSSAFLTWEVLTPWSYVQEGIVAVPMLSSSDAIVTLVANAVSLTPGTVTVDVARQPMILYMHVMHLRDVAAARREVRRLEELAIRAFASARDRDRLLVGDTDEGVAP